MGKSIGESSHTLHKKSHRDMNHDGFFMQTFVLFFRESGGNIDI